MKRSIERADRSKGQAIVEFALIVTLLIIIVLGVFEFGRLWMTMNVLTGAAREGVRIAAVTEPDPGRVREAVENVLEAANIADATVTTQGPNSNNEVTVTVEIEYTVTTGSFVPGLTPTFELSRSAVMHWEG